jgi:hypothetical protein
LNFGGDGGGCGWGLGGTLIVGGGGHTLAAGAHGESGCWEGLAAVGRDHGGRAYFHGPQLLHLPLKPPVLLSQRAEPSLQVLTFHLCLLQLAPVNHMHKYVTLAKLPATSLENYIYPHHIYTCYLPSSLF